MVGCLERERERERGEKRGEKRGEEKREERHHHPPPTRNTGHQVSVCEGGEHLTFQARMTQKHDWWFCLLCVGGKPAHAHVSVTRLVTTRTFIAIQSL